MPLPLHLLLAPVFWSIWALVCFSVLSGKWVHGLVGQAGPVRPDESALEREIRVQWIYASDGPFLLSLALNLASLAAAVLSQSLGANHDTLMLGVSSAINVGFLFANVSFLHGMRHRMAQSVRCNIVFNFAFASALAVALLMTLFGTAARNSQ